MADFVTIAVYSNHYDAVLVKTQLKEQGIDAFVDDKHTSVDLLGGENVGNVKLAVKAEDSEKATELIKTMQVTYEAEEQEIFKDEEEDKKWEEENRLQEAKTAESGKWGFIIVGIIGVVVIVWVFLKK